MERLEEMRSQMGFDNSLQLQKVFNKENGNQLFSSSTGDMRSSHTGLSYKADLG